MTTAFIPEFDQARYFADDIDQAQPSLSSSIAELLVNDCPARAFHHHPKLGGYRKKESDEMSKGSIVHTLLLGNGKAFVELDFPDFRTKAAQIARDNAKGQGLIPILRHKKRELDYAVIGIRERFVELGVSFDGSICEGVMLWEEEADDGTIVQCKAMLDSVRAGPYSVLLQDLKSTESAKPADCAKSMINYGYDIQHAAYTSGARKVWPAVEGRVGMQFVFCELEAPYLVSPLEPDGSMMELGERKWRRAINLWAECTRTGQWHGHVKPGERVRLAAPQWAMEEVG